MHLSCTELVIIDHKAVEIFKRVESEAKKYTENLVSIGDVICFRCGYETMIHKVLKRSLAMDHLPDEWKELTGRKAIIFKNNALYVPIQLHWREEKEKVIGVMILNEHHQSTQAGELKNEQYQKEIIHNYDKNVILREFCTHVNYFLNLCILDMKEKIQEQAFESISQLSK